jgi:hypothetical protein
VTKRCFSLASEKRDASMQIVAWQCQYSNINNCHFLGVTLFRFGTKTWTVWGWGAYWIWCGRHIPKLVKPTFCGFTSTWREGLYCPLLLSIKFISLKDEVCTWVRSICACMLRHYKVDLSEHWTTQSTPLQRRWHLELWFRLPVQFSLWRSLIVICSGEIDALAQARGSFRFLLL